MGKLAIYDSGIGGLSLFFQLKTLRRQPLTYFADNFNFPYGSKSEAELIPIVEKRLTYLQQEHEHIVIACNTASVIYEKYLQSRYRNVHPIVGATIEDVKKYCVNTIGIIGTEATIASALYQSALAKLPGVQVLAQSCNPLVLASEALDEAFVETYIASEFSELKAQVDLLLLSCTHFNRLKPIFERYFSKSTIILPSGYGLIKHIAQNVNYDNQEDLIYLTKKDGKYLEKLRKLLQSNHNF